MSFGGFGGFGSTNKTTSGTGFGAFGSTNNNNNAGTGKSFHLTDIHLSLAISKTLQQAMRVETSGSTDKI